MLFSFGPCGCLLSRPFYTLSAPFLFTSVLHQSTPPPDFSSSFTAAAKAHVFIPSGFFAFCKFPLLFSFVTRCLCFSIFLELGLDFPFPFPMGIDLFSSFSLFDFFFALARFGLFSLPYRFTQNQDLVATLVLLCCPFFPRFGVCCETLSALFLVFCSWLILVFWRFRHQPDPFSATFPHTLQWGIPAPSHFLTPTQYPPPTPKPTAYATPFGPPSPLPPLTPLSGCPLLTFFSVIFVWAWTSCLLVPFFCPNPVPL